MLLDRDAFLRSGPFVFKVAEKFVYDNIGGLWFACIKSDDCMHELVCYKLIPDILKDRSAYFQDALGLDDGSCSLLGKDKLHPYVLPQMIVKKDWECILLLWFGELSQTEEESADFWRSVLTVSIVLQARISEERARRYLERFNSTEFRPATKLSAACECNIAKWISPSFTELLGKPWSYWTINDTATLGAPLVLLIAKTRENIQNMRSGLAFNTPEFVSAGNACTRTPADCEAAWPAQWWSSIACLLLHPDTPLTIHALFAKAQA
ncbi:hypothetical protein BDZ89DRAFT_1129614 [Hymenopellis radicata]|nr:hypothetical protein BDZ89DRAFT_1129614 [Hymenopellis radicata]